MENKYFNNNFNESIISTFEKDTFDEKILSLFSESEEEYQKPYESLKDLADKGEPNSQYYLGCCYLQGLGVKKNEKQANKWFTKSFKTHFDLAIDENAESQFYLSLMYSLGYPKKDKKKSAEWLFVFDWIFCGPFFPRL